MAVEILKINQKNLNFGTCDVVSAGLEMITTKLKIKRNDNFIIGKKDLKLITTSKMKYSKLSISQNSLKSKFLHNSKLYNRPIDFVLIFNSIGIFFLYLKIFLTQMSLASLI